MASASARVDPLYGPTGIADRLAHFLTNTSTRSPVESTFAIEDLHDGHRVRVGALTLTSRAVAHGVPAFGLRVEVVGRSASTRFDGPVDYAARRTRCAMGGTLPQPS